MPNKDSLIGQEIDGYKIEELLGHGGMGRVYRALDVRLNRFAALKVLTQPNSSMPTEHYKTRFDREAQAIAKLKHAHIVAIYRFNDINGIYYMAMEYVDGADLRWVLRDYAADGELVDYDTLLKIIEQIGKGLDFAHKHGVIHRDVKPSNIMISRSNGDAILTDFGLAMNTDEGSLGEIFGSPYYIAPEQAVNSATSVAQTDIYSLGVILFQMLTGSVPYDTGTVIQVAMAHVSDPLPNPLQINPDLNPVFVPILEKVLAKKPEQRYQTAAQLTAALRTAIKEAKRNPNQPGLSTLNKPVDRIKQNFVPLPQIVPTTHTKPQTKIASTQDMRVLKPSTAVQPNADKARVQRAVRAQRGNRRPLLPLMVMLTIAVLAAVLAFMLSQSGEIEYFIEANLTNPDASILATNARIEGQVSDLLSGNNFLTMTVYGVEIQVSNEHPIADSLAIDDTVLLEGRYHQVNDVLRFRHIAYAEQNGTAIVIEDDEATSEDGDN